MNRRHTHKAALLLLVKIVHVWLVLEIVCAYLAVLERHIWEHIVVKFLDCQRIARLLHQLARKL